MTGSYTICWHIFRMGNKDSTVKIANTKCPCKYDPENNPKCPLYEEVIIHQK